MVKLLLAVDAIPRRRHLVRGKSRHFGHQRHRHALSEHVPRRGTEALSTTFLDALFVPFLAGVFLQGGDAVQSLFSELVKAAARAPSA